MGKMASPPLSNFGGPKATERSPLARAPSSEREAPTLSAFGAPVNHGPPLYRGPKGYPTRRAASGRDRGLGPQASSELSALSRARRASAPALRASALPAPRVPGPHPAVASTWKLLLAGKSVQLFPLVDHEHTVFVGHVRWRVSNERGPSPFATETMALVPAG